VTPEQKRRRLDRLKERYHNDPVYKARVLAQQKKVRERPESREKARERARRWVAANPERIREYRKRWHAKEMEKPENRAAAIRRAHEGKLRSYGLTREDYDEILRDQGGVCAICKAEPKPTKRLSVDHNHATGEVRGLLCTSCNHGLGNFRDKPELLRLAAEYLGTVPFRFLEHPWKDPSKERSGVVVGDPATGKRLEEKAA
jgi:hypothetical protein